MGECVEEISLAPTIDLSLLPHSRPLIINQIRQASQTYGFFHVINHGVGDSVIEEALSVNAEFFWMPEKEKEELISDDIYKTVRFGTVKTGDNNNTNNNYYSRDFLKLYANPLDHFISSWPTIPTHYREKMGRYSTAAKKLCTELFGVIMEGLNLDRTHLKQNFEQGVQIMGINCYPPCSGSNMESGISPHTDHTLITLLLQSAPGLHIVDGASWKSVPSPKGSLQVLVGDHLEVISNGLYKSVLHRAIPRCIDTRFSIANLHSLGMDEIVVPVANPSKYRGSSLRDFLKHLASRDTRAFIETLKIDA